MLEQGPSSFTEASAVGTCADGRVLYDANGVIFCGSRDTDDPSAGYINGPDCWAHDATCTAANVVMCGGSDTKQLTSVNGTNCNGTDTVTVTCDGTANVLTHGTHFTCGGTDAACATAIAAAIDALSCVSASAVGTTVGVQPGATTCSVTLSSADATCAVANNGTDGDLVVRTRRILVPRTPANTPGYTFVGDDNTGFVGHETAADTIQIIAGGALQAQISPAGFVSNNTINMQGFPLTAVGRSVANFTSSSAINLFSSRRIMTNTGATAEVIFTLTASDPVGTHFSFAVTDSDGIQVSAAAGEKIQIGSLAGAGACISSTEIGAFADCFQVTATQTFCNVTGTWTVDVGC